MKNRSPLKKKEIKTHYKPNHIPTRYDMVLAEYNQLPVGIENLTQFLDSNKSYSSLRFFCSLIKKNLNIGRRIHQSYHNEPINIILRKLSDKNHCKEARRELSERFSALDYGVQLTILDKFFQLNKITARQAVTLMASNNIWEDKYCEAILREMATDKGLSVPKKRNGILFIQKYANPELIQRYEKYAQIVMPYYYLCMCGVVPEDKKKMLPLEYLEYYLSTTAVPNIDVYAEIYVGVIFQEINKQKFMEIGNKKTWVPSLVSLKNTQHFISLAANYGQENCIKWIYGLDRTIQQNIINDKEWIKCVEQEIHTEQNIIDAMSCFYNYALNYIRNLGFDGDLSKYKSDEFEDLPF